MQMQKTGQPMRLMVIDDEPTVGRRLKQVLSKSGFDVEVFTSPLAALERMAENPFDIVVTDFRMKELNGMQVLEKILELSPRTKVIIITGYARIETATEAFRAGGFDFIAKPFRLDELRQSIFRAARALEPGPSSPS